MTLALVSMLLPFFAALGMLLFRNRQAWVLLLATAGSLLAAIAALLDVMANGSQFLHLGGWETPLAIRFHLMPISALLLAFTALIHLLVALYAARSEHSDTRHNDYWPLSALLHGSICALFLSSDLFNWYVTLELLGLIAVALVTLSGPKAYRPALNYLLLSLAGSLCYLLGVALIYGKYGVLDLQLLAGLTEDNPATRMSLVLMSVGLMVKGALWPLHLWLPQAHASAPTAVSALLSALVVKGPLFLLWLIWTRLAPESIQPSAGWVFALLGVIALLAGGWSALRAPYIKSLVAYSTVAQLGYALLALGLLLQWQDNELSVALWLFVLAHGLAKVSMFLAAGEMQHTLGSKRVSALKGATETMPIAMFAFAVAGGSLIGLPPSGGFIAKWVLLQPTFLEPAYWPWALGIFLGTVMSAAYVFRAVSLSFERAHPTAVSHPPDRLAQWLALLPALLVWGMALIGQPLILWLLEVTAS